MLGRGGPGRLLSTRFSHGSVSFSAQMHEDCPESPRFTPATACSSCMPSSKVASSRTFRPAGTEVFRIAGALGRNNNHAYPCPEGETMAFEKRPSDDITKRDDP